MENAVPPFLCARPQMRVNAHGKIVACSDMRAAHRVAEKSIPLLDGHDPCCVYETIAHTVYATRSKSERGFFAIYACMLVLRKRNDNAALAADNLGADLRKLFRSNPEDNTAAIVQGTVHSGG